MEDQIYNYVTYIGLGLPLGCVAGFIAFAVRSIITSFKQFSTYKEG